MDAPRFRGGRLCIRWASGNFIFSLRLGFVRLSQYCGARAIGNRPTSNRCIAKREAHRNLYSSHTVESEVQNKLGMDAPLSLGKRDSALWLRKPQ